MTRIGTVPQWAACLHVAFAAAGAGEEAGEGPTTYRRLAATEYRDKMKAGWIGQMAGVAWGAPTEFKYRDRIIPEDAVPAWRPGMINHAFGQDDLYVDAGQFIGAMDAEAFFEKDIVKIVEAGLRAIPAESQYAEMVRDMLAWSRELPSWEACWRS
jgi:hypothetical protein